MSATVHRLHPVRLIGHYLRLGHTGHRKLDDLHASGRLSIDRVVADAAHADEQKELRDALRATSTEVILDTRMAELATPGGYRTSARGLDWAHVDARNTKCETNSGLQRYKLLFRWLEGHVLKSEDSLFEPNNTPCQ